VVLDLAKEEAALVGRRQAYARVTVVWSGSPVSARAGDAALVTVDGRLRGWVGGSCSEPVVVQQALAALAEGTPRLVRLDPSDEPSPVRESIVVAPVTCASGGSLELFVEPRLPPPHLVALGRSPMVRALAAMAPAIGFEVTVVERDDIDPVDFPTARVVGELDLAKAGVGPESFIVVATMGRFDEDALEAALATDARYVGLVASARRAAAVCDALRHAGVAKEHLARVRAPAGLDLGALPHTEIAVAILAEIVAQKARTSPVVPPVPTHAPTAVDPVCGMTVEVPRTDVAEHEGVTYWFCASGCRRRFLAEPQRFRPDPAEEDGTCVSKTALP
jgi:xanthine dehydrogenase accessory factor